MSIGKLDELNRQLLKEVQKVLKNDTRNDLNTQIGQLFIFHFKGFEDYLTAKLQSGEFGEALQETAATVAEKYKNLYLEYLAAAEVASKLPPARKNTLKKWKRNLETGKIAGSKYREITPDTHRVFIVENYKQVQDIKNAIGKDFEQEGEKARRGVITGEILKGTKRKDFEGYQLGHGEFGVAVSGVKLLAAERLLSKLNNKKLNSIKQTIATGKGKLETTSLLTAAQVVDSDGNLKKEFIPFISNQKTLDNQEDSDIEDEVLREAKKAVQEEINRIDILNQKGSDSLKEAITATIKYNFDKQKNIKTSGPTKPKKVSKSKSKSKKKESFNYKSKVPIAIGAGAPEIKRRGRRSSGQGRGGTELLGLFNRDLNKVLQQNMTSPRLNYRTGRFADSVKVVDVNTTAKGYPSFGYTYDKFPYQTFEPGYAQGSQQRDPRKLIDASMREIATQYALGRFFTRRL